MKLLIEKKNSAQITIKRVNKLCAYFYGTFLIIFETLS